MDVKVKGREFRLLEREERAGIGEVLSGSLMTRGFTCSRGGLGPMLKISHFALALQA